MTMQRNLNSKKVAIIGAGPGGLAAAKYLKAQGFISTIFDAADSIGGQWNARNPRSGVWTGMSTNTSKVMTSFSDFPHDASTPVYPSATQMQEYLVRYATHFGLNEHLRLNTRIDRIERDPNANGWNVRSNSHERGFYAESFSHVVVATGRYNRPVGPRVAGIQNFRGTGGVTHSFHFQDAEKYRGLRVLVAGCSISALEIASTLATSGAAEVISTYRRQRYVLPKLISGVPTDHLAFTRFAALSGEVLPPEVMAAGLKDFVTTHAGSPEQFGARKPAENVFEAGISQSQNFLPLVAEGRISTRPWMERIDGQTVHFTDGTSNVVDAIIFGTGFHLNLPFLSEDIRRTLNLDGEHLDLYNHTFHPALPGLSFLGLYDQVGPYFPVLELQARWIAYTISGAVAQPTLEEMKNGILAYRARRGLPQSVPMHVMALLFARAVECEPDPNQWPELARALFFGPLAPSSFRLSGPDSLPDAAERFALDAAAFGAIHSPRFTAEECAQLEALAAAKGTSLGEFTGKAK